MKIGIDKIGFYTPPFYVDMADLAQARDTDPAKYQIGLGQDQMAVAPISQDTVTMAVNAANQILTDQDRQDIDFVIVGTETGIDQSKASAVYVHDLLNINPYARAIEMKEACYGATVGLQTAVDHIARRPDRKALVIASDIARYGLNTSGEPTQGAGAVAILVSANPRIAAVSPTASYYTGDIMDFWRPNYSKTAQVDGHYSTKMYLDYLTHVWEDYKEQTGMSVADLAAVCLHLPYGKMGEKGLRRLTKEADKPHKQDLKAKFVDARAYNRQVGNVYTASLYLSLISLLEHNQDLAPGDLVGMYSYGSGAVGEFFTLELMAGYRDCLNVDDHQMMLDQRQRLTVPEYEAMFTDQVPEDGGDHHFHQAGDHSPCQLVGIKDHMRCYQMANQSRH
ncbi:hydroxymethylglutaryl-CoA synthase [Aerococcus urinaehominis]|uniref:Hydroxymethylglutaryl-CoA synthase n=1 Tax=Aerococcus urinaehominis TaxID=128944 RepID=A0A0X8FKK2_9LACT|nr:hydroxymethylglutaryl-CoA synthase [Aerococcus urinaehominis]AMB99031.1 hydroxymethylglutaryl-CoA synthase [Aerococcus urinaehominis]SDM51095.1 hydroxymethylglutaryl-CoA synthase [Aerococcus urinaehominis]